MRRFTQGVVRPPLHFPVCVASTHASRDSAHKFAAAERTAPRLGMQWEGKDHNPALRCHFPSATNAYAVGRSAESFTEEPLTGHSASRYSPRSGCGREKK